MASQHPWSSTGQTTKYSLKIFKINFLGARLWGNKLLSSVWTSASHWEQRSSVTSQTEIARQYFFGKRWKPRICPAEFFDFNSRYLENENEFLKNSFETVFRASKSRDRGQLVSAFQLTFKLTWSIPYNNLYQVTNWCIMADFQTLNCCYLFRIQPMLPKFRMALVTKCDLLS